MLSRAQCSLQNLAPSVAHVRIPITPAVERGAADGAIYPLRGIAFTEVATVVVLVRESTAAASMFIVRRVPSVMTVSAPIAAIADWQSPVDRPWHALEEVWILS